MTKINSMILILVLAFNQSCGNYSQQDDNQSEAATVAAAPLAFVCAAPVACLVALAAVGGVAWIASQNDKQMTLHFESQDARNRFIEIVEEHIDNRGEPKGDATTVPNQDDRSELIGLANRNVQNIGDGQNYRAFMIAYVPKRNRWAFVADHYFDTYTPRAYPSKEQCLTSIEQLKNVIGLKGWITNADAHGRWTIPPSSAIGWNGVTIEVENCTISRCECVDLEPVDRL